MYALDEPHYRVAEQLTHRFTHKCCGNLTLTEPSKRWTIRVHHAAKTRQRRSRLLPKTQQFDTALFNKCGGKHDMAVSFISEDGPIEKQSTGQVYEGKTLPKRELIVLLP
jgi:hypothetical protein